MKCKISDPVNKMLNRNRAIEIETEIIDGVATAIMTGYCSPELYINTLASLKEGMNKEYGEGNYSIDDRVKVN